MPTILIATHNPYKVQLFGPVFQACGFQTLSLRDLPSIGPPPKENGATLLENATAKVRRCHSRDYPWVFGDDAGLEIDALNGEPGVQARRWGGRFPSDVDDQTWLDYLLLRLKDIPPERRTARFTAAWVLLSPDGALHTHLVESPFQIATRPLRPIVPGSPISAVRLGPPDEVPKRQREIAAEWQRWGILERLNVYEQRF